MKPRSLRAIAIATIASLSLAACGGGGGGGGGTVAPAAPAPGGPGVYTGPSALTYSWNQAMVKRATYVGPLSGDPQMTLHVGFKMRNEQGLLQYAQAASDPKSPAYRHFLTPEQIGAQFGASNDDVAAVASYFHSNGLSFTTWPQHLTGVVHGKRSAMEKAFGVTFGMYQMRGTPFIGPVGGSPHFTQAIPIRTALLASHVSSARTHIIRFGYGQFAGYSPQQIAHGFDYSGAWGSGLTGSGITVGIIGTGPIDVNPSNGGDVGIYQHTFNETSQFGLGSQGTSLSIVAASPQPASTQNNNTGTNAFDDGSGLATPPPVTAPCPSDPFWKIRSIFPTASCNPEDSEAQLDTESIAGLAPNSTVKFYLAFNANDCLGGGCPPNSIGEQGLYLTDDEIQQAIADNSADVLSLSYGLGEYDGIGFYYDDTGAGVGPDEFAALASEGIAVFVSSGDNGNEACQDPNTGVPLTTPCVSWPASDPSVVGVGGVNIPLDSYGHLTGQIAAWADQTTSGGNGMFGNNIGAGGGVSQVFKTPTAQTGVEPSASSSPASPQLNGYRGVPDIALDADGLTGPSILINGEFGGGFESVGGTSAAAPESAAMWALVLQACKAVSSCANAPYAKPYRLGDPKALIYQIYKGDDHGLKYGQVFADVLYGENQANGPGAGATPGPPITGCCTAGTGYDLVTGVGAPFAGHLIQAVTGTTVP